MDLTQWELDAFRDYISSTSGLHFDAGKSDLLESAIKERLQHMRLRDLTQYSEFLKSDPNGPAELKSLFSLITINETNFFRHPDHFKALKEHILPELIEKRLKANGQSSQVISFWSAGCSSGDEAYSIAISALDMLDRYPFCRFEILGTDIDDAVLTRARSGLFSRKSVQHLESACREKFFKETENGFQLDEGIRNMVTFAHHNLGAPPYPAPASGRWDVIFCRNVIIYFSKKAVAQAIGNFHGCLADGGYLFLGYSESLHGISDDYSLIRIGETFVYKKEKSRRGHARHLPAARPPAHGRKPRHEDESMKLYAEAAGLFAEKSFDEALAKISAFLEKKPNDARGHLLAGRLHLEHGRIEEASRAIRRALDIEPLLAPAYFLMGTIYEMQHLTAEAAEHFKKALYLDGDFALAHFSLASMHRAAGDVERALRGYRNVIRCLEKMPPDRPLEFASGYTANTLMKTCKQDVHRLQAASRAGVK